MCNFYPKEEEQYQVPDDNYYQEQDYEDDESML